MLEVAKGTLYLFFLFFLIGLGPSLYFLRKKSFVNSLAVAPAIGLSLIAIFSSYLILLDFPIDQWASLLGVFSVLISLALAFFLRRSIRIDKVFVGWCLGLILTAFLLILPMIIGGFNFTFFRGNVADTFNYIILADFLQHEKYSWGKLVGLQEIINHQATYAQAKQLLADRWPISVVFGWSALLTHIPLYRLEYGFTILLFMITYGCAYAIALLFSPKIYHAILIALVVCVGFWSQVVMDIRALSHISVISLLLLFIFTLADRERGSTHVTQALLGLILSAIAFLYIEIIPLVFLGLILFNLQQILSRKETILTLIRRYWLVSLLFFAFITPIFYEHLFGFFTNQIKMAIGFKNNWHHAYFKWLYSDHLIQFWGHALIVNLFATHSLGEYWLKIFLYGWGLILAVSALFAFFYLAIKKNLPPIFKLISAFSSATLIEFIYLLIHEQWWAAGKAFTYGYPFLIFMLAILSFNVLPTFKKSAAILKIAQYSILLWLGVQLSLSILRIDYAWNGKDYPHYVRNYYHYRNYDWDVKTFTAALKQNHALSLGLILPDYFVNYYLDFVWGRELHVINYTGIPHGNFQLYQTLKFLPEYIILPANFLKLQNVTPLARNKRLILLKANPEIWQQVLLFTFTFNDGWVKTNSTFPLFSHLLCKTPNQQVAIKGINWCIAKSIRP